MTTQANYTTVNDVRSTYLAAQETVDDALIAQLITTTSREIEAMSNRHFYPRVETRYYDVPRTFAPLLFDDDLLSLTTLTNGDGTAFTAGEYVLYPLNKTPKEEVRLQNSSSTRWQTGSNGDAFSVISAAGIWGYHDDYSSAWIDGGITLSGSAGIADTALSFSASVYSGQLLNIDGEYIAPLASGSSAVSVARAVNGSTSGSHAQGASVTEWDYGMIGALCRQAVAAYYRLRANPVGETISIDGQTFATPKDVRAYISKAISTLGAQRMGFS